ncbi:hypothetical protein [Pelagicoccus sp. SDUM812005]|uniref:hypothetical protein n=1 Tax=Pelagicoccus sp. SDUM812005 TaxID=3041257 RepID=UPI00280D73BE|nr:hypothetical protein [Pelagicoccus sp. SDUM812005]MDQ8180991.1 hypothetical protein [Pelagicoccus sp. SDUM812005]
MCQLESNANLKAASPPEVNDTSGALEERLLQAFAPLVREVEENIELYFSDLASASETISGECFDDDTHASFYVASREVIAQGLAIQLEFLRDNAPHAFSILLRKAGFAFPCDR